MPAAEEVKSSWADEVELEGGALPPSTEVVENGLKIVTEYKLNEDEKKVCCSFFLTYSNYFLSLLQHTLPLSVNGTTNYLLS